MNSPNGTDSDDGDRSYRWGLAESVREDPDATVDALIEKDADLERLRARIFELETGEVRVEWGVRHLDNDEVRSFGDYEYGAKHYVEAMISRPAQLMRREVRTSRWAEAS